MFFSQVGARSDNSPSGYSLRDAAGESELNMSYRGIRPVTLRSLRIVMHSLYLAAYASSSKREVQLERIFNASYATPTVRLHSSYMLYSSRILCVCVGPHLVRAPAYDK